MTCVIDISLLQFGQLSIVGTPEHARLALMTLPFARQNVGASKRLTLDWVPVSLKSKSWNWLGRFATAPRSLGGYGRHSRKSSYSFVTIRQLLTRCGARMPLRGDGHAFGRDHQRLTCLSVLRAGRLNRTKLTDAKLDRAILDQACLLEADLSRASLRGANIFAAQMQRAKLDGADLSGARIAADLTGASLVGAVLVGANLGADMKNQSMGLMRAVLKSANLERAVLRDADVSRVDLEFASLRNADLTNASLRGAALGGATLARVTLNGADFNGADLASMRLIGPIGLDAAKNFDKAQNIERLLRE